MTHIETGIQEDAMKVLDVLLEHYPALLAARPAVLLTNFLELISHRQSSGGAKKAQDAKGRTWALSVNPNRAVTSQQWRLSVLLRYECHVYTDSVEISGIIILAANTLLFCFTCTSGLDAFCRQWLRKDQWRKVIFLTQLKECLAPVERAGLHLCTSTGKSSPSARSE